jgi:hypothetical protein
MQVSANRLLAVCEAAGISKDRILSTVNLSGLSYEERESVVIDALKKFAVDANRILNAKLCKLCSAASASTGLPFTNAYVDFVAYGNGVDIGDRRTLGNVGAVLSLSLANAMNESIHTYTEMYDNEDLLAKEGK